MKEIIWLSVKATPDQASILANAINKMIDPTSASEVVKFGNTGSAIIGDSIAKRAFESIQAMNNSFSRA